ncbi:uncharacterized protein LOC128682079 [Plodia interpunctella]|uniref:uncharacterized protein LOC128682079 n=1 Tax=Plodia interpunctella TaxID=58824 RepID=UPI0023678B61|nr:uncharacterized protein LOC128682079 [Plodia interpunctella]
MGAKSPVKLKLRRPMFKCNICHRKLLSAQALKTHQYSIHKFEHSTSPSRARVRSVMKAKTLPKKVPATVSKATNPISKTRSSMHDNDSGEDARLAPEKVSDLRRIQFECPKCNCVFPAYFSAFKHIQKNHCMNSRGLKVEASSPDLIKPLRVEVCVKCNNRVRANDMHLCSEIGVISEGLFVDYLCMGCKQKFASMQLFDLHVSGLHSDGVESLFFPNMHEFLTWKTQMQSSTKTNYLIFGKCNLKQTFRCTYLPPAETTGGEVNAMSTSHICPAGIIIQEFTKGIQVHFYKTHHGHTCPEYVCPEKYKKYLITTLMQKKNTESFDVDYNEKDIYCQFKVLLESIIIEAAKVKVDDLKLLIEKALEMTSILNNYDEDDDTYSHVNSNSLCEEQIVKALDSLRSNKRKSTNPNDIIDLKRKKQVDSTPRIVNSFSMANSDVEKKEVAVKKKEAPAKKQEAAPKKQEAKEDNKKDVNVASPRVLRNTQIQSPTFNDTYKDFVDKNFKPPDNGNTNAATPVGGRNRPSIKQSTLATTTPPDNEKGIRLRPLSKLVDSKQIEEELAKDDNVPAPRLKNGTESKEAKSMKNSPGILRKIAPKENKGPDLATVIEKDAKATETQKHFTPKTKPKKQVMKTKIGQFKPNSSPKSSPSPKKSEVNLNRSIGKMKPDVEYEVMEQENDCNILILKI